MADSKPQIIDTNEEDLNLPIHDEFSINPWNEEIEKKVDIYKLPDELDEPSILDYYLIEVMNLEGRVIEKITQQQSSCQYIEYKEGSLHVDTLGLMADTLGITNGTYQLKISSFRDYIHRGPLYQLNEDGSQGEPLATVPREKLTVIEKSRTGLEARVVVDETALTSFESFYKNQLPGTMPDGTNNDEVVWPLKVLFDQTTDNGQQDYRVSHNWMYHAYTAPDYDPRSEEDGVQDTIILKFTKPLPNNIAPGTKLSLTRELFVPFSIPVNLDIKPVKIYDYTELRGPNLRIQTGERTGRPTNKKSFNDLTSTGTTRDQIVNKFISGSNIIDSNLDYQRYENFVHFSSAEQRLRVFFNKMENIEYFESKSAGVSSDLTGLAQAGATASTWLIANKSQYDRAKNNILANFTDYEYYLYYESSSRETKYIDDGIVTYNPYTWPKTGPNKPYTNYSVTSSEALAWYNQQIATASAYDQDNPSALNNFIPTHIRVDNQSTDYIKLMDMMGDYFDVFFNYVKMLENSFDRNESVYEGISKDLLYEIGKSLGWYMQSGYDAEDLWSLLLGTDEDQNYQASGSGETLTFVKRESYSKNDLEKQTWKRILNNLPLMMKTKGSSRSLRSLLASYGIPSTILRIQEYGGPVSTKKGQRRAIEKFNYALNFSGSTYVRFVHSSLDATTSNSHKWTPFTNKPSSALQYPQMYEWRIDTQHTESMHLFGHNEDIVSGSEAPASESAHKFQVVLEHSSSAAGNDSAAAQAAGSSSLYSHYGRLTVQFSGSDGYPAISCSTDYAPFYNNDWWNISIGFTERPTKASNNFASTDPATFIVRYAAMGEGANRIIHSGSATMEITGSIMEKTWLRGLYVQLGGSGSQGTTDYPGELRPQAFSGSMQEFRAWAEYLSDDAFHEHTLSPTSIVGDTVQAAYNDMYIRFPMGTDFNATHNGELLFEHAGVNPITVKYTASVPFELYGAPNGQDYAPMNLSPSATTARLYNWGQNFDTPGKQMWAPKSETYYVDVPFTAGPRPHANKIRIEDNKLRGNLLQRDKSFEVSSYDSNPLDTHYVDVSLSPADQIDTDIAMQFGAFSLADYIADPRDKYKSHYTSLRDLNNLYFKKHSRAYNVWEFIKFVNLMNKGLFRQIESMLPGRADATVGISIRPTLLERHKLNQPVSMSQETMFYTGSFASASSFSGDSLSAGTRYESRPGGHSSFTSFTSEINMGVRSSQQGASGSNTYVDRFQEGSEYLKDIIGETTQSFVQITVSESRQVLAGYNTRIQIPTYNIKYRPEHNRNVTGSGWYTMYESDFSNPGDGFPFHEPSGAVTGDVYSINPSVHGEGQKAQLNDKWRIMQPGGEITIEATGSRFGNNADNDEVWAQWNNPFPVEPNSLYRLTGTILPVMEPADGSETLAYIGAALFTDQKIAFKDRNADQKRDINGQMRQLSFSNGTFGYGSQAYTALAAVDLEEGIEQSFRGFLSTQQLGGTSLPARNQDDLKPHERAFTLGMQESIYHIGGFARRALSNDQIKPTHVSPLFIVNYNNQDGVAVMKNIKLEKIGKAYVDVQPQYDCSDAQRRLVYEGTKVTSPDFNIGSTDTIDGGPPAEYVLVNPNIVSVTPSRYPESPMIGVDRFGNPVSLRPRPGANRVSTTPITNPAQNITVR